MPVESPIQNAVRILPISARAEHALDPTRVGRAQQEHEASTMPYESAARNILPEKQSLTCDKPELFVNGGDPPATAREQRDLLACSGRFFDRGVPVKVVHPASGDSPLALPLTPNRVVIEAHGKHDGAARKLEGRSGQSSDGSKSTFIPRTFSKDKTRTRAGYVFSNLIRICRMRMPCLAGILKWLHRRSESDRFHNCHAPSPSACGRSFALAVALAMKSIASVRQLANSVAACL